MSIIETIRRIVEIPQNVKEPGSAPFSSLLEATGYFVSYNQVSEADIREALARSPNTVQQWLAYSEDKRSTSGWYISQDTGAGCLVGYFSAQDGSRQQIRYDDLMDGCAAFIKREIEGVRGHVVIHDIP